MSDVEENAPMFKITDLQSFKKVYTILMGGDPDAVQIVTKFMNLDKEEQGSFFPDKLTTLSVTQSKLYARSTFKDGGWNPFANTADEISSTFKGYKGFKSDQLVQMTQTTEKLPDLTDSSDEVKQSLRERIFGGKKE